jgi:predicted RNA-binding protein YlxR (DUF448 family)
MNKRTCLVTGKTEDPSRLLRFTISDGALLFDDPSYNPGSRTRVGAKVKKNPGRGGYVLNDPKIIKKLPHIKGKIQYYLKVKNVEIEPIEDSR